MKATKALIGGKLFDLLMKSSFYGHFVAGEDRWAIVPKLERFKFMQFLFCFVISLRKIDKQKISKNNISEFILHTMLHGMTTLYDIV